MVEVNRKLEVCMVWGLFVQDSLLFFKERFNLNVSALHKVVVEVNEPIKNISRLCL